MNKLSISLIGSTLISFGIFSQTPTQAATFQWTGTQQDGSSLKGNYTLDDQALQNYANTISSGTGAFPSPLDASQVSLLVNGADTGPGSGTFGLEERLATPPGGATGLYWRWSLHIQTPWDSVWIGFGTFDSPNSALRALPGLNFTNGDGTLIPASAPTTTQLVTNAANQIVPEPSPVLGILALMGLGIASRYRQNQKTE